jgi:translation initiation factor IF-1
MAILPLRADAFDIEQSLKRLHVQFLATDLPDIRVAQKSDGMTLAQAIELVRRQTNGRILSAETRVSGKREMHHIKVLTKDGKVRTHQIPGRTRR